MPKVRMLQAMEGIGVSLIAGDIVEVDLGVAEAWAQAEIAVVLDEKNTGKEKGEDGE